MKGEVQREIHYDTSVLVNQKTEPMRREECLCLNCDYENCEVAHGLFATCKDYSLALIVTRCPDFKFRGENG
jgi:hypothetical protein